MPWTEGGVTEPAEGEGVIGTICRHEGKKVPSKGDIGLVLREEAQLPPDPGVISLLEGRRESLKGVLCLGDGDIGLLVQEREKTLGEAGEIPVGDERLVGV